MRKEAFTRIGILTILMIAASAPASALAPVLPALGSGDAVADAPGVTLADAESVARTVAEPERPAAVDGPACRAGAFACVVEPPHASPRPAGASTAMAVFVSAPCTALPRLCASEGPERDVLVTPTEGPVAPDVLVRVEWMAANAPFAGADAPDAVALHVTPVTVAVPGVGPVTVAPCAPANPCLTAAGVNDAWLLEITVTVGDAEGRAVRLVSTTPGA